MELLKGAVLGCLAGCLVSLVAALVLAVSFIHLFVGWEGAWPAFRNLMVLLPIIIGLYLVPISVVLGLVHANKRVAARVRIEVAAVSGEGGVS